MNTFLNLTPKAQSEIPLYPVLASLWGFLYFYYESTLWKNNKDNYWKFSVPTAVQSELDTVKG